VCTTNFRHKRTLPVAAGCGAPMNATRLCLGSTLRCDVTARVRIVLLAADGVPTTEIADRTGTSRPTVLKWRGCRRSFESDQSCSLKVTTPGDSPFEIRWL
jgi:Homeodomain-like domain